MEILIKESLKLENLMEKEYIDGIMVQYIKACLIKDIEME
jgi:hypothetical protein